MDNILVTVICTTYNHRDYIEDALKGFLMQKTSFPFEVIVHDDASTDGTQEIVRKYESENPEIIKGVYQPVNLYSQKKCRNAYIDPLVRGKYIARCEGDDYWTDPDKLQKQVDFLESHPDYSACAHAAKKLDMRDNVMYDYSPSPCDKTFSIEEIIAGRGTLFPTNSLMQIASVDIPQELLTIGNGGEYQLYLCLALAGKVYFMSDCMSVYRYMAKGSWTSRNDVDIDKRVQVYEKQFAMMKIFNEMTDRKYEKTIFDTFRALRFSLLHQQKKYKEMLSPEYDEIVSKVGRGKYKLLFFIEKYFPGLLKIYQRKSKSGKY